MAKILTPIAVNDLNSKQGIGIDLPFDGNRLFDINYLTKDQIKANLINLFLTSPGERLQNPFFGVGLKKYLFENEIDETSIQSNIQQQVDQYIYGITVQKIDLNLNEDENSLNIIFTYSFKFEEKPQQLEITLQ
jgi:phage baseplate assembly protein W